MSAARKMEVRPCPPHEQLCWKQATWGCTPSVLPVTEDVLDWHVFKVPLGLRHCARLMTLTYMLKLKNQCYLQTLA